MTLLDKIVLTELETQPFETGAPDPSRLIRGAPAHRTWILDESADGKMFAGIWESTPGAWRVVYDEWEFCTILAGVSVVTPDNAPSVTLKTGDSFVIRPGFTGVWDVVETTRKSFVIRLP
jgi:uncharacterized cupin superfamily protein